MAKALGRGKGLEALRLVNPNCHKNTPFAALRIGNSGVCETTDWLFTVQPVPTHNGTKVSLLNLSSVTHQGIIMKLSTRILLPVAFALTAGAAFAEGPLQGNEVFNFSSNLSRAEVRAETIAARDAGLLTVGEITQVNDNFVGAKTRARELGYNPPPSLEHYRK